MMKRTNYDKFPKIDIEGHQCIANWDNIIAKLQSEIEMLTAPKKVVVVECYHGVDSADIISHLKEGFRPDYIYNAADAFDAQEAINNKVYPYVTDDPVFGYVSSLSLSDFFDSDKVATYRQEIDAIKSGLVIIVGIGASVIVPSSDLLIYADMPRWEIQLRFRANKISNIGVDNPNAEFSYQYKRSFFVDWRVCDKQKKKLMHQWNYVLDTTGDIPKMITGEALKDALTMATQRPFRVVPFFDPGPWGGQWLKEICDLDREEQNFAWAFDCVPEENSLLLNFNGENFEIPSINLVYSHPQELLGKKVYDYFGAEFPIRFDILDTLKGGNLSLQVHPNLAYIREKFGMPYTQEESYYFLDAEEHAIMYLGLKENINENSMIKELADAQQEGGEFDADKFVEKIPIKKHDHILIPAGTIHCSGADSVVLEISATPYNFTFKLWDWGRMGLNGKPRPISLEHGEKVIEWNRTTQWSKENLVNKVALVAEGDGWKEEKTGLYEGSFIETHRYWFTEPINVETEGVVNVLNLVEGEEVIVESPEGLFEPYVIHYAETFIVPAAVNNYTIRPYGRSEGKECAVVKAFVQVNNLVNYQQN